MIYRIRNPRSGAWRLAVVLYILAAIWVIGMIVVASGKAGAVEIITGSGGALNIEVSKGRLVRLDRPANTVFIADPEIADIQVKTPRLVYLLAKKPGETTLFAVDDDERVLANIAISVTHNLGRLRHAINQLLPDNDIRTTSVGGSVVIDGVVSSAAAAADVRRLAAKFAPGEGGVINRLKVDAPNQVNLRVRIAEVSREIDKRFGINTSLAFNIGIRGLTLGLASTNPFANAVQTLTFSGGDISSVIDALEEEGLVTVLAEPNLTAVSGETASFLAGGEFPILVPDSDGKVTIQFKKFGVSLAFTPTVVSEGRINLHVRPEVSQLSATNAVTLSGFEVPSLTTRRTETTVELAPGQSFAIAGLLQNNVTHDVSKFPGLGDIPVLGALFKSDRFQRQETELVIIVTPYLVRPSSQRLAAPTDGFVPTHDIERLFPGGTNKRAPKAGAVKTVGQDGRTLIGPVGFQLD